MEDYYKSESKMQGYAIPKRGRGSSSGGQSRGGGQTSYNPPAADYNQDYSQYYAGYHDVTQGYSTAGYNSGYPAPVPTDSTQGQGRGGGSGSARGQKGGEGYGGYSGSGARGYKGGSGYGGGAASYGGAKRGGGYSQSYDSYTAAATTGGGSSGDHWNQYQGQGQGQQQYDWGQGQSQGQQGYGGGGYQQQQRGGNRGGQSSNYRGGKRGGSREEGKRGGSRWDQTSTPGSYKSSGPGLGFSPANPNKRKATIVVEIGGGGWINEYDKRLPQDIIDQCSSFVCKVCDVTFTSDNVRITHYQGKPHEKKVDALLKAAAEKSGEPPAKKNKAATDSTDTRFNLDRLKHFQKGYLELWTTDLPDKAIEMLRPSRCEVCKLSFKNTTEATQHMNGKPHDKKMVDWLITYCKVHKLDMPTKVSGEELTHSEAEAQVGENGEPVFLKCDVCNITSSSFITHTTHISGKKHQKAVEMQQNGQTAKDWRNSLFKCEICMISVDTAIILEKHLGGKVHAKKVKTTLEKEEAEKGAGQEKVKQEKETKVKGSFLCELCNVTASSEAVLNTHLEGKAHKKRQNMKERSETKSEEGSENKIKCEVCNIEVTSQTHYDDHCAGRKHLARVKMQEAMNEDDIEFKQKIAASKQKLAADQQATQQQIDHCQDVDFEEDY